MASESRVGIRVSYSFPPASSPATPLAASRLTDAAELAAFDHVDLAVPTLHVDTSDGYRPELADVVAFARGW